MSFFRNFFDSNKPKNHTRTITSTTLSTKSTLINRKISIKPNIVTRKTNTITNSYLLKPKMSHFPTWIGPCHHLTISAIAWKLIFVKSYPSWLLDHDFKYLWNIKEFSWHDQCSCVGHSMNWAILFTTKLIFGRVIERYWNDPTNFLASRFIEKLE